jgi:hypothetical protein
VVDGGLDSEGDEHSDSLYARENRVRTGRCGNSEMAAVARLSRLTGGGFGQRETVRRWRRSRAPWIGTAGTDPVGVDLIPGTHVVEVPP